MKDGITYKEKYNNLIKEIKEIIKRKEAAVKLASEFLQNDDLIINYEIKSNIVRAIYENRSTINTLTEVLSKAEELEDE